MNVNRESLIAAWPVFLRAHAEIVAAVEQRLSDGSLPSLIWYDVLWALEQAPERTLRMGALADAVVLSRSNLSHVVARLEAQKLVTRRRSTDDGRGAVAALTDKGAALRRAMWPTYRDAVGAAFTQHLKPADARALDAILRRVLASRRRAQG
ncbi:MarR family winged helix-turn-helix transcriptional regulator [Reyranella sp. CPCC 100927]|uniref:MarR family winged helix-turn-helix transcriptional regulator n=1 Tax=Reyranella sp. CPCC 100927 TaxID=2599616 RepID=UPI0011B6D54C|nr:MarR family transcriptional regulator [Reyranella sp. CPCC 100927]TWS97574.1 MarR family transcriptional regulator [Reyranella sp. CPCC 100927]